MFQAKFQVRVAREFQAKLQAREGQVLLVKFQDREGQAIQVVRFKSQDKMGQILQFMEDQAALQFKGLPNPAQSKFFLELFKGQLLPQRTDQVSDHHQQGQGDLLPTLWITPQAKWFLFQDLHQSVTTHSTALKGTSTNNPRKNQLGHPLRGLLEPLVFLPTMV